MAHKLVTESMVEKALGAAKWNNWSVGTRNGIRASLEAVVDEIRNQVIEECAQMAERKPPAPQWPYEYILANAIRSLKSQGQ